MVHNNMGIALAQLGRPAEAADHFRAAIAQWPEYDRAHHNLGLVLALLGDPEGAIEHHRLALHAAPGFSAARLALGDVYRTQRRFAEAAEEYKQALPLVDDKSELHFKLGTSLLQAGQWREAIESLRASLEGDANSVGTMNSLAWALATLPEGSPAERQEAIDVAMRAVELSGSRDPRVLDTLATALAAGGQIDAARVTAKQALQLATDAGDSKLAETIREHLQEFMEQDE